MSAPAAMSKWHQRLCCAHLLVFGLGCCTCCDRLLPLLLQQTRQADMKPVIDGRCNMPDGTDPNFNAWPSTRACDDLQLLL